MLLHVPRIIYYSIFVYSYAAAFQNPQCEIPVPQVYELGPDVYNGEQRLLPSWQQEEDCSCDLEPVECVLKLIIPFGHKIQAKCPGVNNGFVLFNTSKIEMECAGGMNLKTIYGTKRFEDFSCIEMRSPSEKPIPRHTIVELEGQICNDAFGDETGIWHRVSSSDQATWYFDLCYNPENDRTIYTISSHNFIEKPTINHSLAYIYDNENYWCGARPLNTTIYTNINVDLSYGKNNHNVENAIAHWTGVPIEVPPRPRVFDKGHLVPAEDFAAGDGQSATYNYVNAQAQYTTINNGNWALVEASVRDNASNIIVITTGTYGRLQRGNVNITFGCTSLADPGGEFPECPVANIDATSLPIPRFYIKEVILQNDEGAFGYMIFNANDPEYQHENLALPPFFRTICSPARCRNRYYASWLRETLRNRLEDPIYGYTYCCDRYPAESAFLANAKLPL